MSEGFIRPKAEVLPETALVPAGNLISPAPNRFTHELTRPQPYYYDDDSRQRRAAAGEFAAGTRVVLLVHDGGDACWVADGRGLYVQIDFDSLKPL